MGDLRYDTDKNLWHGHNEEDTFCIVMSDATFQKYVASYAADIALNVILDRLAYATQRCIKISYWAYARYDRDIALAHGSPGACVLCKNTLSA